LPRARPAGAGDISVAILTFVAAPLSLARLYLLPGEAMTRQIMHLAADASAQSGATVSACLSGHLSRDHRQYSSVRREGLPPGV
jgi:hypothetical protein